MPFFQSKTKRFIEIAAIILIALAAYHLATPEGAYGSRFKLYRLLLTKPLEEIRGDYAAKSCNVFSSQEKEKGYFEAFVTGYCKPRSTDFKERQEFLCSVALNCSCPNGKVAENNCASSSLSWRGCKDFDESKTAYCHQTASEVEPEAGHLAADWGCFAKNSLVEIDGKSYTVTDKGGLIKGRRFDLWFDDCQAAAKATGIYKVKLPPHITSNR